MNKPDGDQCEPGAQRELRDRGDQEDDRAQHRSDGVEQQTLAPVRLMAPA
jgi:hypothetical protein